MYRHNGPRTFITARGKAIKDDYYYQLKQQYREKPVTGDIILKIDLVFGDKRKRDIDNYNKLMLDTCTGILWEDDSQIVSLLINKFYEKGNPRIELSF